MLPPNATRARRQPPLERGCNSPRRCGTISRPAATTTCAAPDFEENSDMTSINRRLIALWTACGSLLAIGDCALSDQQLTSIAQSVISTGLNTIVSQLLTGLGGGAA
jgi:hypothetical protein